MMKQKTICYLCFILVLIQGLVGTALISNQKSFGVNGDVCEIVSVGEVFCMNHHDGKWSFIEKLKTENTDEIVIAIDILSLNYIIAITNYGGLYVNRGLWMKLSNVDVWSIFQLCVSFGEDIYIVNNQMVLSKFDWNSGSWNREVVNNTIFASKGYEQFELSTN